jgi:hypothetical protein
LLKAGFEAAILGKNEALKTLVRINAVQNEVLSGFMAASKLLKASPE